MAEIFLSYANEDRETAGKVAALLESAGLTVWWDRRIPAGRTWRSVLEEALTDMRCMVVLWSSHSIDSHWVKEEAEEARALEKLVPVLIESVNPPVGFRSIQAADLTHWDGSRETEGSRQLIADLQSLLGEPLKKVQRAAEPARQKNEGVREPESPVQLPAHPSDDERRSEPTPAQPQRARGITSHSAVIWKTVSAGVAALAVLLGALWLWPKREEPVAPEPAIKTETAVPATPSLMNLTIRAPRNQLKSGETLVLRLESQYSDGTKKEIKEARRWASSNANVASVDEAGLVKALQAGTTIITASDGKVVTDPWTLTVQAPQQPVKAPEPIKLVALAVSGARGELRVHEKMALRVKASYSDGSWNNSPAAVDWQSSDRTIAAVNARGELEGLRPGQIEVRARAGEVSSAPLSIRIAAAPKTVATETPQVRIPETGLRPPHPAPQYPNPALPSPPSAEALEQRVAPYLARAKNYRVQGNYAAALAELEKARAIDASRPEIRLELEQTRKACNAEKSLGYNVNC